MGRRFVAQLSVVTGDSELFDQPKLREQLRFAENGFGEDFLVKEIEAPGPEPDQIDQEDGDENKGDEDDSSQPLQDSFKHTAIAFAVSEIPRSRVLDSSRFQRLWQRAITAMIGKIKQKRDREVQSVSGFAAYHGSRGSRFLL